MNNNNKILCIFSTLVSTQMVLVMASYQGSHEPKDGLGPRELATELYSVCEGIIGAFGFKDPFSPSALCCNTKIHDLPIDLHLFTPIHLYFSFVYYVGGCGIQQITQDM